jgi:WD40 repeat protein
MTACPWKLAVCGKKVIMNGHFSYTDAIMPVPSERIFVSIAKDCTARLWDINDQTLIDCFNTMQPVRSCTWWSRDTLDGPDGEEDLKGSSHPLLALGLENGSVSIWRLDKTFSEAAAQDDAAGNEHPFFDPENAFGRITLCSIIPLPRPVHTADKNRTPSEQVFCLKYSPDGKYLAVGTGDNCVDIYVHKVVMTNDRPYAEVLRSNSKQKAQGLTDEEINLQDCFPYRRVGCFNDHSSSVLALDFSADGTIFRSVSSSNELLFGMLPSGKLNNATQECSSKQFRTHTCKFGWTVKSIWARGSKADDINAIDVSKTKVPPWAPCFGGLDPAPYPMPPTYISSGSRDPADNMRVRNFPGEGEASTWGHQVAVSAQDDGKVKLFRYPAFGFKQAFRSYIGHGSHVMDARFTYDDDYVITAGGTDMAVFQWRHVIPNKVYVQNLPDAKNADGTYKIGFWEMRQILKDYFSKLLKVDHEIIKRTMAADHSHDHDQPSKIADALRGIPPIKHLSLSLSLSLALSLSLSLSLSQHIHADILCIHMYKDLYIYCIAYIDDMMHICIHLVYTYTFTYIQTYIRIYMHGACCIIACKHTYILCMQTYIHRQGAGFARQNQECVEVSDEGGEKRCTD